MLAVGAAQRWLNAPVSRLARLASDVVDPAFVADGVCGRAVADETAVELARELAGRIPPWAAGAALLLLVAAAIALASAAAGAAAGYWARGAPRGSVVKAPLNRTPLCRPLYGR